VALIERMVMEIAMQANMKPMLRIPSLVSALTNFCTHECMLDMFSSEAFYVTYHLDVVRDLIQFSEKILMSLE